MRADSPGLMTHGTPPQVAVQAFDFVKTDSLASADFSALLSHVSELLVSRPCPSHAHTSKLLIRSPAQNRGFVPVLHGDAVLDKAVSWSILSGDVIMQALAAHFRYSMAVVCTDLFILVAHCNCPFLSSCEARPGACTLVTLRGCTTPRARPFLE